MHSARLPVLAALLVLASFSRVMGQEEESRRPVLPAGKELGLNAELEEGADARPSGWYVYEPAGGMRIEWGSFGISGSKGLRFSPPEGATAPIEAAGINQTIQGFEPGKSIEVTAWLRLTGFSGACVVWARCDGKDGPENREGSFQNSAGARYAFEGSTIWSPVTVRVTPGEKTLTVSFGVLAGGEGTVQVDEMHARQAEEPTTAQVPAPGLFLAEGRYRATASRDGPGIKVVIPVPLLWREQVPLSFAVLTEPEGSMAAVRLVRREHGTLLAEVTLADVKKGQTFLFRWEAYVLVRPSTLAPIPPGIKLPVEGIPTEIARWLQPTWCCDAKDPEIRKVADELLPEKPTAEALIPALLERMAGIFQKARERGANLTATEAMTKQGSCTSCANVGAALLRACGIPARIIAGYPTWSAALQTHYVVEYWLPGCGWRVMETTMCQDDPAGCGQIEVAMVVPEDEAREKADYRPAAAGGVPHLTLTEYPDEKPGTQPAVWLAADIPGQAGCDHRAFQVARIEAGAEEWKAVSERLARRWEKLSAAAVADPAAVGRLVSPKGLPEAKTLGEMERLLGE